MASSTAEEFVRAVPSLLTFVLLLALWTYRRVHGDLVEALRSIPGMPGALPLLGNTLNLINKKPAELFKGAEEIAEYGGPVAKMWVLHEPQVIVSGARYAEIIMRDMTYHHKSRHYSFLHDWMGLGLLTSNGEKWRVHRKVLTPAFHFNILHEFLPIFNKHALKLTQCLAKEQKITDPKGFDIFKYSSLCALDIICESAMGCNIDTQSNENSPYAQAVKQTTVESLPKRYFTPWLRFELFWQLSSTKRTFDKNIHLINSFADKVISERRNYLKNVGQVNGTNIEGSRRRLAFLDLLLAAEAEGAEFMTPKDIRDQVATFMFEGHDTVSTAMCWVLFLLGTYPEIQDRVVAELDEVFGDSGRAPDMNDLTNLKYLERCIKESARLYPSVPFYEREAKSDLKLREYFVPAGCCLTINAFSIQRDPEFWPDPEKFDPDRFLPENSQGRHPYAYLNFSAGPRNCIGQRFALMEEKAVVSAVLRRYRVEAAHTLQDAELQFCLVLRPVNGLHIRLYDRDSHPKLRMSS